MNRNRILPFPIWISANCILKCNVWTRSQSIQSILWKKVCCSWENFSNISPSYFRIFNWMIEPFAFVCFNLVVYGCMIHLKWIQNKKIIISVVYEWNGLTILLYLYQISKWEALELTKKDESGKRFECWKLSIYRNMLNIDGDSFSNFLWFDV